MSVIIHIGQPKAASSSLQRALWERRLELEADGILYLDTPTRNHNGVVADFLLSAGVPARRRFLQDIRQVALPGSWSRLTAQLRQAPRTILSSEYLINLSPAWIQRFVDELGVGDPEILLIVRRTSDSLPSSYSQMAKTVVTMGFEPWLRALLRFEGGDGISPLNVQSVRRNWSLFGVVRTVLFQPNQIDAFEDDVLGGLAINVKRPFLGLYNKSPSAAMVEAWQRLLRQGRVLDASLLKSVPDVGSGRYALHPDVARVVDSAYPMEAEGSPTARAELRSMILRSEPLTTTGLADEDWARSVADCTAGLEEALA
jgi:hypothetical protein